MEEAKCPIWQSPAKRKPTDRDGSKVWSPRAGGEYFIARTAEGLLSDWDDTRKVRLTSWLVEQRRLGISCPEILSSTLRDVSNMRPMSVHDRADKLLQYLESASAMLGHVDFFSLPFKVQNHASGAKLLAWTASREITEVITLSEYCHQQGWVKYKFWQDPASVRHENHELMLLPSGYAHLADIRGIGSGGTQAFVAMWFDELMHPAYENGIAPAIRDAGYEPLRVDKKEHNNKIDDEIVAEIRRSCFVVADFTQGKSGARGGVYYEAGYAHGLNVPVIFTCREDAIDRVHFDTRQYNHITWKDPEQLRERLAQRISATIGDGPNRHKA